MNEFDIEKISLGVLIKYRDLRKALKFFETHDEEGKQLKGQAKRAVTRSKAVAYAVHFAGLSVRLTQNEEAECLEFAKANYDKRMAKRAALKIATGEFHADEMDARTKRKRKK